MNLLHRAVFLSLNLLISSVILAQAFPEFGNFTVVEKEMKQCSFDKEADAVIIFEKPIPTLTTSITSLQKEGSV